MAEKKVYDKEFKVQSATPGREIGFSKAASKLGISVDTLYGWNKQAKNARLNLGVGSQTPETAAGLVEEVILSIHSHRNTPGHIKQENSRVSAITRSLIG